MKDNGEEIRKELYNNIIKKSEKTGRKQGILRKTGILVENFIKSFSTIITDSYDRIYKSI